MPCTAAYPCARREASAVSRSQSGTPRCVHPLERTLRQRLVRVAKARWWIERDDQELKQELGLGHYEGRNWRGFHHHASLCIAAYGFLVAERCLFPPQPRFIRRRIETPALPAGFQPRGAASAA